MNEILLNTMIDKVDTQEKKITEQVGEIEKLKEVVAHQPDFKAMVDEMKNQLSDLKADIRKINFPEKEVRDLSTNLSLSVSLLKRPVKNKTVHHHHISQLIWITAILFIVFCLVCSGWFMTEKSLELFQENDTKYRYMKIHGSLDWKKTLSETDSLYLIRPNMRQDVLSKEEQIRRNLEMLQRAKELEQEAKEIKRKAGEKKEVTDLPKVNPARSIPGKSR